MGRTKLCLSAETRLKGVPLAPGIAVGRACFYEVHHAEPDSTPRADPQLETERLSNSLRWLARQRSMLARKAEAKLGSEHAGIFEAHRLMLADEAFQSQLLQLIQEDGCSAEKAVETELNRYMAPLEAADSEYLQQRVADIREIRQALLGYLGHRDDCRHCRDMGGCSVGHCGLGNDHILVGEEISASLPIEMDDHTVGFIVDKGGPNCHAVILARALGYPVIGNIQQLPGCIPPDAQILANGDTGEVILDPTAETLSRYQSAFAAGGQSLQHSEAVAGLKVMANIERSADVHDAIAAGAEGVGLYRTEMELLVAGRLLSEAEQAARYREVVTAMAGKPVCIRLLDLGADKTAEWLVTTRQADAVAAGQRGARLLLARPELLREQARALAHASKHGPIHVLYPMIVDVGQFLELRALFDKAVADLQPGGLQHGVLFEVPAACLAARQIMQVADFGCIGTNDLVQYLFAEDRGGGEVGQSSFETDGLLWEIIQQLSRVARQAGKPMAICGELAGNPDLTHRILQAGITAISTSPSHIAMVRRAAQI